jgi:hypothetical protein
MNPNSRRIGSSAPGTVPAAERPGRGKMQSKDEEEKEHRGASLHQPIFDGDDT